MLCDLGCALPSLCLGLPVQWVRLSMTSAGHPKSAASSQATVQRDTEHQRLEAREARQAPQR